MTVPATATAPTSTSLSPGVWRFSEARLVPDTLTMAWRSLITMMRNPGEFYDILIQPVMFTVLFGELFGGAIAGDVKAYLPTIVPGLIIMNALTTSQSVGVDLREDMDKGVFDRSPPTPLKTHMATNIATMRQAKTSVPVIGRIQVPYRNRMENNKLEANAATSPFEKSVMFRRPRKKLYCINGECEKKFHIFDI